MNLSRPARYAATLAPCALVLVFGLLLHQRTGRLRETDREVHHSLRVIGAVDRVVSSLTHAETLQRAYLLTGDPYYLSPYRTASGRIAADLAALRAQAAGDSALRPAVDTLDVLARERLSVLDHTLQVREVAGLAAAQEAMRTGRGTAVMNRLREVAARARRFEEAQLAAREREERSQDRALALALVAGTLLAGLASLVLNLALARYARAQAEAAREIETRNVQLEEQAAELEEQAAELEEQTAELEIQAQTLSDQAMELEEANASLTEASERIGRSEEHFRALIENSAELIMVLGPDRGVRYASPAAERLLGLTPAQLAAMDPFGLVHPEDLPRAMATLEQALGKPGTMVETELRVRAGDDGWRVLECSVQDLSGLSAVDGLVCHGRDVTARRNAERAVREANETFRTLVESSPLGIMMVDAQGVVMTWNPAAERVFGWTAGEVLGRPNPIVPPEYDGLFRELIGRHGKEGVGDLEVIAVRRDGERIEVSLSTAQLRDAAGEIIGTMGLFADLTARKRGEAALRRTQEQLIQAQKMDAVGRLAGGVAHDFNNLLTVINGNVQLLLMDLPAGDPLRAELEEIKLAVDRASALTRQLLAFSRKQVMQPQVVSLPAVVRNLEKMLGRLIGEDVAIAARLDDGESLVRVDPGQMEQVITNLVVNARDAMPAGGRVELAVRNVELGSGAAPGAPGSVPAGSYVLLSVRDTGTGMDPAVRDRVFEPFFTTKAEGKGTGLGLSTVYGIVQQSGGHVWIESEPGAGTEVFVCLPRVLEPAPAPQDEADAGPERNAGGRVLVAEDESGVRALVTRVLEREGYHVSAAANAEEAHRIFASNGGFDLLLTDVVMPGGSGRELVEGLLARRPELKVLFMSGYNDDALAERGVLGRGVHLIEKPFEPQALLRKVRELLSPDGPA